MIASGSNRVLDVLNIGVITRLASFSGMMDFGPPNFTRGCLFFFETSMEFPKLAKVGSEIGSALVEYLLSWSISDCFLSTRTYCSEDEELNLSIISSKEGLFSGVRRVHWWYKSTMCGYLRCISCSILMDSTVSPAFTASIISNLSNCSYGSFSVIISYSNMPNEYTLKLNFG